MQLVTITNCGETKLFSEGFVYRFCILAVSFVYPFCIQALIRVSS
jgi:hypothetical protein